MLHNVLGATHHNRGNAISLEMPGDQAGGLVANRTVRDQNRGIHSVLPTARKNFRRVGFEGDAMATVGRCPEEARSDSSDAPFTHEPLQLRQGKPGSAVLG